MKFLDMSSETWKYPTVIMSKTSELNRTMKLSAREGEMISKLSDKFGNKPFLLHQIKFHEQFSIVDEYSTEEQTYLKSVRPVPKKKVPGHAEMFSSHKMYKLKYNEDGSLKLKARIAPHGNEDDLKKVLKKDCTTCPKTELSIFESVFSTIRVERSQGRVPVAFL